MVRSVGIEPTQVCTHMPLKHACLPVPPRPHDYLLTYLPFPAGGAGAFAGACAGAGTGSPAGAGVVCCCSGIAPSGGVPGCAVPKGRALPCKTEEGEKLDCFSALSLSSDFCCLAEGCERKIDMMMHSPMKIEARIAVVRVSTFAVSCVPNMLLAPARPPPMAPEMPPPLSD